MKNILYILIVILFTSFNVGSGTAILKCKSASGRTEFYAEIENIEGILEKAILKIDDTSLEYKTEEANVIFDPKNGVFTMFIDDFENKGNLSHKYLQFWAIPSSFKILKNDRAHQIYEFKAIIYGSEPRENKEFHIPKITLDCKLEYKI